MCFNCYKYKCLFIPFKLKFIIIISFEINISSISMIGFSFCLQRIIHLKERIWKNIFVFPLFYFFEIQKFTKYAFTFVRYYMGFFILRRKNTSIKHKYFFRLNNLCRLFCSIYFHGSNVIFLRNFPCVLIKYYWLTLFYSFLFMVIYMCKAILKHKC